MYALEWILNNARLICGYIYIEDTFGNFISDFREAKFPKASHILYYI
jgi:hypothetical protein